MKKSSMNKEQLNNSLKLLAKSSFVVLIGIFLAKIFSYIYRIIIARQFGPEVYGLFSLAVMVSGFFIIISSLGLIEGLLRQVSLSRGKKKYQEIKYIYALSLKILVISTLGSAVLLFILADFISIRLFHNANLIIYLKVFSFIIPLSVFSNLFLCFIRAFEEIRWYSFIQNILQNFTKLIFLVIFVFFGFGQGAITGSYFLGMLVMLFAAYVIFKHKLSRYFTKTTLNENQKKGIVKELISYSWPIVFLSVSASLLYWIDSFSIGYFKSAEEVGFYNAAVPIVALLDIALAIFLQLFFPLMIKEYAKGNLKLIGKLSKQVGKWIFIINLPIFLILFFFPGVIINLFFGKTYLMAANPLRILSIGALVYSILSISNNLLLMTGRSKLILVDIAAFSITNLMLNSILVPIYGMSGAAFSTTICYVGLGVTFMIQANKYSRIIPLKRKMFNVVLSSIPPLVILFYLRRIIVINILSLILAAIFFVLSYLLLVFLFKGFDKKDILILNSIKNKIFNRRNT